LRVNEREIVGMKELESGAGGADFNLADAVDAGGEGLFEESGGRHWENINGEW
jgi:hypothetical protein